MHRFSLIVHGNQDKAPETKYIKSRLDLSNLNSHKKISSLSKGEHNFYVEKEELSSLSMELQNLVLNETERNKLPFFLETNAEILSEVKPFEPFMKKDVINNLKGNEESFATAFASLDINLFKPKPAPTPAKPAPTPASAKPSPQKAGNAFENLKLTREMMDKPEISRNEMLEFFAINNF